jgi:thiamine-monophosphate kinase
MDEQELIDRFTRALPTSGEGVVVGPGDDAAVVRPPAGNDLILTVDAVVEGVHFDARFSPMDVGWKALAVNLSDLAAMGARPLFALAALTLPEGASTATVLGIARGLGACARAHACRWSAGTSRGRGRFAHRHGDRRPKGRAARAAVRAPGISSRSRHRR